MTLKVLGSSSKGNCYIFDNGREALIVEAGIRFNDVKKALGFNLRKVVGCLVTHRHGDHAGYVRQVVESGITTLALEDVWEAKGISDTCAVSIIPGKRYRIGNFKVLPFAACHDVPCVGYLIEHPETGLILFLTDSFMCEYTFPGLNQIMIECNYSDSELTKAIIEGRTMRYQRERLMTSHLELETCKGILLSNDLSKVENVVLLHLSANNADEDRFVREIQRVCGKIVYVANPGLTIEMSRYDQGF
ncbi:MAG: MBL fold metallo-hydrolase [Candidatus Cryptobacteroides sp.]